MKVFFLLWLGLLQVVVTSYAQDILDENCTQGGNSACIDWERGVAIAEGLGVPSSKANNQALKHASALRAAKLDAARNLLELIKGINLDSSTLMSDAMISSDVVRTQIQGKVRGLRPIGQPRYFSDGTVKIRLEARILDTIPQALIQKELAKKPTPPPLEPLEVQPVAPSKKKIDVATVYTGLVIDATGLQTRPAMSPKVYDDKQNIVYGIANVDRSFFQKYGMASYVKNQDSALNNDRVQGNPLLIKAIGMAGKHQTDLLISSDDAHALRQMEKTQSFLREARVIIIID